MGVLFLPRELKRETMTANYQPLNHKQNTTHWIPPTDLTHIAGQPLLPLHAGEVALAASTMPLALTQRDGVWQLVGVAGLQPQHNLFVHEGKWLGRYQPRSVSTYDFDLQTVGKLSFLRFNLSGKLAASADSIGAQPMFQDDGRLMPAVQQIQDQLLKDAPLFVRTQKAVQALVDADVLMPYPDITGMAHSHGLYMIDEAALAKLDEAAFLTLRKAQALGIAYAVNLSLQQTHLLKRLEKYNPAVDSAADIDTLFGEGGDDTLKFNF